MSVCEGGEEGVCVCECVSEWGGEGVGVCVCGEERERVCVCVCVCVWKMGINHGFGKQPRSFLCGMLTECCRCW